MQSWARLWKWKSLNGVWLLPTTDYRVHGILQARILEWVAVPFFKGSSQPRDQTQVSHIAGGFFTSWVTTWGGKIMPIHMKTFLTMQSTLLQGIF